MPRRVSQVAAALAVVLPGALAAQGPRVAAVPLAAPVRLDGRLDDAAWAGALEAGGFRQVEPVQGDPATSPVTFRVAYDAEALYVAIRVRDAGAPRALSVQTLRRDFDEGATDFVAVALGQADDPGSALVFAVNPRGALADQQLLDGGLLDREWDGLWQARTRVGGGEWTAELALPWRTLRYRAGVPWKLNVWHHTLRRNEVAAWSPWPRGAQPSRLAFAGDVEGLEPPPAGRNVRVQPFVAGRSAGETLAASDAPRLVQPGLDAKAAITPAAVLDLTVRPDFGDAEVDRQQLNLGRFTLVFPERRPFFLENRGLFVTTPADGVQPFFSRRVGLSTEGTPERIDVGARFVARGAERSVGLLAVRQRDTAGRRSTFGVARATQALGPLRAGAMLTSRLDDASGGGTEANHVLSGDLFWRPTSLTSLQATAIRSWDARDGVAGWGGNLAARVEAPRLVGALSADWVDADLRLRSGLVPTGDLLRVKLEASLDLRPRWLPPSIRRLYPGVVASASWLASDGTPIEAGPTMRVLDVRWQDGRRVAWQSTPVRQVVRQPFDQLPGIPIAPGDYRHWRHALFLDSDRSRPVSASFLGTTGGWYDGQLHTATLTLRWNPGPRAALQVAYNWYDFRDISAAASDRVTWLLAPEAQLALSPRLRASVVPQWNHAQGRIAWNARVSWEYLPLSFVHVVYGGDDALPNAEPLGVAAPGQRRLLLKASWLGQL